MSRKWFGVLLFSICLMSSALAVQAADDSGFTKGKPDIRSMSTLSFGPDGVLAIGDSRGGAVFLVETGDKTPGDAERRFGVEDVEAKFAAALGAKASDVMIHDMAVNPISRTIYFSVSRARQQWGHRFSLPNDLADAADILTIGTDGTIGALDLSDVAYRRIALPNPIGPEAKHPWKEDMTMRVDAITDLVFEGGTLYVSGLSSEEFSAALWRVDLGSGKSEWTTLEIFHGAHGEWETAAPIRTFLPYSFDGAEHILASYLCTPLVSFRLGDLAPGAHVKGHTLAEFGSGNYPLDMVKVHWEGQDIFVMANSQLPLMTFRPEAIREAMDKPGITRETPTYAEGVAYTARAGSGVQQIDNFNDNAVAGLQRLPNGRLNLVLFSVARMAL